MKTIIAGSRDMNDYIRLRKIMEKYRHTISEVVCGMARGVDTLGYTWAQIREIPVKEFPANWDLHGKSAGYKRNEEMAQYAEACICLWDGESKGTKHMIDLAILYKLELKVIRLRKS